MPEECRWGEGDEEEEEEMEEVPSCFSTINCGHFLVISIDKLTARYTGDGKHGNDVGSIQANHPAPSRRLIYYFEMTLINSGQRGVVSIGFSDASFKTSRHAGWEPNSFGYHGDDGKLYYGVKSSDPFGPKFATGDTVGAGINFVNRELFFTWNGKLVGTTRKELKFPLYPTVGLHSPDEHITVNFGQAPFVYDVEALIQDEREKRQRAVEKVPLPLSVSHSIVRAYLLHYGYQDTLSAFDDASGGAVTPSNGESPLLEAYAIEKRKVLRRLARDGDMDGMISKLQEWYPKSLQDGKSKIAFLLNCQKFIELVKAGSLDAAVSYARAELANYFGVEEYQTLLQDCLALLAYERPASSPVGYLLSLKQRETVADAVNAFVMSTNPALISLGQSAQSSLEKLLRQLTACQREIRLLNGEQGEVFRLSRILQGNRDGGW